jgi:hypothetical protein
MNSTPGPGPLDQVVPTAVILAVYVAAGAGLLLAFGAARLIRRAIHRRHPAPCDRDVPHDRVTLSHTERAAWLDFRVRFEMEAEAEEQAAAGEDTP